MKNQKSNPKEITPEEQKAIDEINLKESGLKEKDFKNTDVDTKVAENPKIQKETPVQKQKHSGEVVQEGMTNGNGSYIPYENGKLSDAYKEQTKDWKPYKRYSDGSIKF